MGRYECLSTDEDTSIHDERNDMKLSRIVVACVAILIFLSGVSLASTFYVATTGDDSRSCSTAQNIVSPKRTITSGLGCVAAGDTLYVRGGTYSAIDSNGTRIPTGTSWTDAPVIAAYAGETVIISGSNNIAAPSSQGQSEIKYVIFDGMKFNGASGGNDVLGFWGNVHHIRIKNCEAYGAPAGQHMGISMQPNGSNVAPSYNEIINCKFHNNGVAGEQAHGMYIAGDYNLFDKVESYNNPDRGVQIFSMYRNPTGNIIRNSNFHDNGNVGITVYGDNNFVYNNLTYNNNYGIGLTGSNHKVYHNTAYNNSSVGISSNASGVVVRNNIAYQNGTNLSGSMTQDHNLTTDPGFVDAANKNFALKSGSAAINAGQTLSEVTTDFAGNSRPQGGAYDIGAYEFTTSTTLAAPNNLIVQP